MPQTIRAKMKVQSIMQTADGAGKPVRVVQLHAVTDDGTPENKRFHRFTPNASLNITIDNPAIAVGVDVLAPGSCVYVDLIPIDDTPTDD